MPLKSYIAADLRKLYRFFFARKRWQKLNMFLYDLSLRGMGILNYENCKVSGEKHFLAEYLGSRGSSTVIDVGANIGEYAQLVLKIQPSAKIFAIEPHPATFLQLQTEGRVNNFKTFNFACDAESGPKTLYDYKENDGSPHASMYKEVIEKYHRKDVVSHSVMAVTLDDFIKNNSIDKIDLLKIDAEGNEINVLKGCRRAIEDKKIKVVQFEFNEIHALVRIYVRDFFEALPGFALFRLLPSGLIPLGEYRPTVHDIYGFQNIVAINRDQIQEINGMEF